MSEKNFYIPSLDGLRTVAFTLVFLSHVGLEKIVPGALGVTIFFFLSGYLITTLLRREFDRNTTISLKKFYARRALRIWPPFYLVLFIASVLTITEILPGEFHWPAMFSQLLHVTNYFMVFGGKGLLAGTGVYWSLAVEEHFYLLFPCIYLLLRKKNANVQTQRYVVYGLCIALLIWRCVLVFVFHVEEGRTGFATDARVDSILFGCALAIWGNPVIDRDSEGISEKRWKFVLAPAGAILLLSTLVLRNPAYRATIRYTLQGIALYPLFSVAVRYPDWLPVRVLNSRIMKFLGLLSYSLYLVHYIVIDAVNKNLPELNAVARAVLAFVISLVVSYASYKLVEQPFGKLRKRFEARRA